MDGTEATREIRRIEQNRGFTTPETQSYIVALTGKSNGCRVSVSEYFLKSLHIFFCQSLT